MARAGAIQWGRVGRAPTADSCAVPAPFRPLLAAYSAALRRALGDDLRGIYLYGSVALEAYLPGSSDLDVAVLHGQDLTSGQREALSSLHRTFPEAGLPVAGLLDVSFVPLRLVGSDGEPSLPCFRDGRFQTSGGADVNAVLWHTLRRRGITVWGPPAHTLVPPVSAAALARDMHRNLGFLSRRMPHYVQAGAATQVFGVLSLCRVLHTLRTGEIVSKLEAAQWALGEIDPAWRPLVQRAAWRYRRGDMADPGRPGRPAARATTTPEAPSSGRAGRIPSWRAERWPSRRTA